MLFLPLALRRLRWTSSNRLTSNRGHRPPRLNPRVAGRDATLVFDILGGGARGLRRGRRRASDRGGYLPELSPATMSRTAGGAGPDPSTGSTTSASAESIGSPEGPIPRSWTPAAAGQVNWARNSRMRSGRRRNSSSRRPTVTSSAKAGLNWTADGTFSVDEMHLRRRRGPAAGAWSLHYPATSQALVWIGRFAGRWLTLQLP